MFKSGYVNIAFNIFVGNFFNSFEKQSKLNIRMLDLKIALVLKYFATNQSSLIREFCST